MPNPRDLSKGVIIVFSGGPFDEMNPPEVRERMDLYIDAVNADPFVQTGTSGGGLTFKLLPGQATNHLHQAQWRDVCRALNLLDATPLIVVGHSNGGAAALNLARCLNSQRKSIDALVSCDSVLTLDDIGNINEVPSNVHLNVNSYVIPTPAWLLAPFPIGKANVRQVDHSLDGIVNIGLRYTLPGALAHRNAFYDLCGGDKQGTGFTFPFLLRDVTLQVLCGATTFDVVDGAVTALQTLSTAANVEIEVATTGLHASLRP